MRRITVRQTTSTAAVAALGFAFLLAWALGVAPFSPQEARGQDTDIAPSVVVWPGVGELHSGSSFAIMGAGFEPGQEVHVLLQTSIGRGFTGGVVNDITENVNPPIEMIDETGNFAASFDMGRFERVLSEGVIGLTVTDADFTPLASAPVAMCDPSWPFASRGLPARRSRLRRGPGRPAPNDLLRWFLRVPRAPGNLGRRLSRHATREQRRASDAGPSRASENMRPNPHWRECVGVEPTPD